MAVSDLPPLVVDHDVLERGVELLPIPAAHVRRDEAGWRVLAANEGFRRAGLADEDAAPSRLIDALAPTIEAFLASDSLRHDLDWSPGEVIDRRFYRVTLARSSRAVDQQCLVSLLDRTQQILTERSLRREMTTDSLTGLPNREGFGDLIEAVDDAAPIAVLVIDLSRFGRVNACLGGLAGDELLITVARRIKGALRARDALARIGGDEFGILLRIDDARDEADRVAERIARALSAPFRLTDYEISVDCSIGMAFADGADPVAREDVVRHAQFAVKRAKISGLHETYEPAAFTIAREQFGMETELRRAIEDGRLRLAFQPICDLATRRIITFEALARWTREDGCEVSPSSFIPVAEESGLIVPLGRWAIEAATQTLAQWDRQSGPGGCGLRVAVNLSPIQLQRDAVHHVVEAALARAGLGGDRLKLELTESALVADPAGTARTLRALKDMGAVIAMDDFGTGHSNLALLQALPIDLLKIDRSFVTGMLGDRDKLAIVRAVLGLAQALSMRTVAEGIETDSCAQTLAALGCAYGQGYHFSRPLDAGAAYALVAPPLAATA